MKPLDKVKMMQQVTASWRAHSMPCPEAECEGRLVLRHSTKYDRPFYGCDTWSATKCPGGIGAHKDGKPLGIPADQATKKRRMAAHNAFDQLWKGPNPFMSRGQAYKWIAKEMGREIHMAELDSEGCEDVICCALDFLLLLEKRRKR